MLTPTLAKQFLAEHFKDKIAVAKQDNGNCEFFWLPKESHQSAFDPEICMPIDETSWQQIALWVAKKLTRKQRSTVVIHLFNLGVELGSIAFANYIEIATAMKESRSV